MENLIKLNINDVIYYTWNNLKLNFKNILNEIYDCLFILDDNIDKKNIMTNITKQSELRNIIIDGLILSDLKYSNKFFNIDLYNEICKNFQKFNPHYKLNIYQIKNKKINKLYPQKYIKLILKGISKKLKLWLKQMCQNELNQISLKKTDNKVIYINTKLFNPSKKLNII